MTLFPARPFAYSELGELGIGAFRLHQALENHEVRRVVQGVYAPAGLPDDPGTRLRAARLALAPGQVACDRTAAWIHGLDMFGWAEHENVAPIETCALRSKTRSRMRGVDGRTRDLRPEDVAKLGGVLVTTPLRTAADLGCALRKRDALAALDQFRRLHDVSEDELIRLLPRFRGRRGVVQLRSLIPLSVTSSESVRESWTRLALHEAGLPQPVVQHWIVIDGVPTYRLDLAYPANRVAIEYDGEEFHSSDDDRSGDERRRSWLRQNGWTVVVVRNGDFTGVRLDAWVRRVQSALAEASSNRRW